VTDVVDAYVIFFRIVEHRNRLVGFRQGLCNSSFLIYDRPPRMLICKIDRCLDRSEDDSTVRRE
jgi:hypothetical protein